MFGKSGALWGKPSRVATLHSTNLMHNLSTNELSMKFCEFAQLDLSSMNYELEQVSEHMAQTHTKTQPTHQCGAHSGSPKLNTTKGLPQHVILGNYEYTLLHSPQNVSPAQQ